LATAFNFGTLDLDMTFHALVAMLILSEEECKPVVWTLEKRTERGLEMMLRCYEDLGVVPFSTYAEESRLLDG
jgi:hypothetical protein